MAEASVAVKMPPRMPPMTTTIIQQQLEMLTLEGVFLRHIATTLGDEACHQHNPQSPQDAGDVSSHEQGGNGDAACHCGIDDQGVAGRDQHAGRGRGNVDRGAEGGIVVILLLDRGHDAADGRRGGDAGPTDGAK